MSPEAILLLLVSLLSVAAESVPNPISSSLCSGVDDYDPNWIYLDSDCRLLSCQPYLLRYDCSLNHKRLWQHAECQTMLDLGYCRAAMRVSRVRTSPASTAAVTLESSTTARLSAEATSLTNWSGFGVISIAIAVVFCVSIIVISLAVAVLCLCPRSRRAWRYLTSSSSTGVRGRVDRLQDSLEPMLDPESLLIRADSGTAEECIVARSGPCKTQSPESFCPVLALCPQCRNPSQHRCCSFINAPSSCARTPDIPASCLSLSSANGQLNSSSVLAQSAPVLSPADAAYNQRKSQQCGTVLLGAGVFPNN